MTTSYHKPRKLLIAKTSFSLKYTMASKTAKRNASSIEESSLSDSTSTREDEKTIPFLRRLTDMLRENDEVISFFPGYRRNGQVVLGKIIVHDRHKVEADVLPRYFNHASFASLRRQLNYFRFTRVGKGRQRGATYCNEAVVELEDILHLKRRTVGTSVNSGESGVSAQVDSSSVGSNPVPEVRTKLSVLHPASHQDAPQVSNRTKRSRNSKMNSFLTPEAVVATKHITVDLSVSQAEIATSSCDTRQCVGFGSRKISVDYDYLPEMYYGDADILAGCNALLSFSRSHHNDGIKYTA